MPREIPWYDETKKHTQRNQLDLDSKTVVYLSDYKSFRGLMTKNPKLRRILYREAVRAQAAWKRQIPYGKDGSDGHIRDHVKIKSVPRGGWYKDRMTYIVYNDYPRYDAIDRGRRKADGREDTWYWAAVKSMGRGGLT